MTAWLDPVRAALASRDTPLDWFIRDDDGGWADAALRALLERCERAETVVEVAVIPDAIGADLVADLAARWSRGTVRLHQHGRTHENHEPTGRKCEFGSSRSVADQVRDLRAGRDRLLDAFGDALDPVFTPPWNRCTTSTCDALVGDALTVLSRDITATPFVRPGLAEIPVTFDWSGVARRTASIEAFGLQLGGALAGHHHLGLMLHHEEMTSESGERLTELIGLLHRAGARATSILDAAAVSTDRPE